MNEKEIIEHDKKFIKDVISGIREQMIAYLLWKTQHYDNIDEYRKDLKKELKNIHNANMKFVDEILD